MMKILLLGDASAFHANLATGLRRMGHSVTVASDGTDWMQTDRNIDLIRRSNKVGGALLWIKLSQISERQLSGYDIVHLSSPSFVPLKPCRLAKILHSVRANNGRLIYSVLGTDSDYVRNCLYGTPPVLRYSEWRPPVGLRLPALDPGKAAEGWLADDLSGYTDEFFATVDGAVTALYEYHKVVEIMHPTLPTAYCGIPVDTSSMPIHKPVDGPLRILNAAHKGREAEKGADILLDILKRIESEMQGEIVVESPENVPYSQFVQRLAQYDIVSDQLFSFTPATTALMAMAMGVVPISGGEPEFYEFIGEPDLRPIFNPDPTDIDGTYHRLKALLSDRDAIRRLSEQGREFVRRYNDTDIVAHRVSDFWQSF